MKRVILDTNIYGFIVDKEQIEEVKELAEKRRDIIIYGFDIVRKELRNTPKDKTIGKRKYRVALLMLYNRLTRERSFPMNDSVRNLAGDYMRTYKTLFGAVNYSMKTYEAVNSIKKLRTPQFIGYSEFRRSILL